MNSLLYWWQSSSFIKLKYIDYLFLYSDHFNIMPVSSQFDIPNTLIPLYVKHDTGAAMKHEAIGIQ